MSNIPEYKYKNGGAAIEIAASKATNPYQFDFPVFMAHKRDCNFSFAGLKHSVLRHIINQEKEFNVIGDEIIPDINNLCAGFQLAAARHIAHKTKRAMDFIHLKDLIPEEKCTLVNSQILLINFNKYLQ